MWQFTPSAQEPVRRCTDYWIKLKGHEEGREHGWGYSQFTTQSQPKLSPDYSNLIHPRSFSCTSSSVGETTQIPS